jgi:hypothetical protein
MGLSMHTYNDAFVNAIKMNKIDTVRTLHIKDTPVLNIASKIYLI